MRPCYSITELLESLEKPRRIMMMVKAVAAVSADIPAPSLLAAVGYVDALRAPWLPANLIQAQRDYFGAHTYHRRDEPGVFHTEWGAEEEGA